MGGNLDSLYDGMQALEGKIIEAANKTQKVNDMMTGLTGKTSMDAFNRMEQKVEALEAAAEVSADMAKNAWNRALAPSSSKKDDASDIELQFRMLESSDSVENELEKLKSKILPPSESKKSTSKKSIATKKIAIEDLDRMQ